MASKLQRRREADTQVLEHLRAVSKSVQLGDRQREARRASIARARETLFIDDFTEVAERVFKGKITPSGYAVKKAKAPVKRILNLLISDTHFRACLDERELGHSYGALEEARRLAAIVRQAVGYKTQYRDQTALFVHLLGDIIQGQLHDMRDGAPMAEQVAAAIHLLVQALTFLAKHFPQVVVRCATGNHGRLTSRHKDRATNQKWDSIETMVYVAVKVAMRDVKNVKVEIPLTPYYTFKAFNKYGFLTHGDTVLNPGYPNKSIDVTSLRRQINEINGNPHSHEKYSLFATGHVHIGALINLPNDAVLITNGPLIPSDAYANSIGIFDTACGQYLWESTEKHMVGDSRFLNVGFDTDKDSSLDSIIKPLITL